MVNPNTLEKLTETHPLGLTSKGCFIAFVTLTTHSLIVLDVWLGVAIRFLRLLGWAGFLNINFSSCVKKLRQNRWVAVASLKALECLGDQLTLPKVMKALTKWTLKSCKEQKEFAIIDTFLHQTIKGGNVFCMAQTRSINHLWFCEKCCGYK